MKKILAAGALAFASVAAFAVPTHFVLTADDSTIFDKFVGDLSFHDDTFDVHFNGLQFVDGLPYPGAITGLYGFLDNASTDSAVIIGGEVTNGDAGYEIFLRFVDGDRFVYTLDFGQPVITTITGSVTAAAAAVPEPETYALLLAGLGVVVAMKRRAKRA